MRMRLKRAFVFLRLMDEHDGQLSLTNLLLLIAAYKFATLTDLSLTELTAIVAMLGAYVWKGHGKRVRVATEGRIAAIEGVVTGVKDALGAAAADVIQVKNKVTALDNRVPQAGLRR